MMMKRQQYPKFSKASLFGYLWKVGNTPLKVHFYTRQKNGEKEYLKGKIWKEKVCPFFIFLLACLAEMKSEDPWEVHCCWTLENVCFYCYCTLYIYNEENRSAQRLYCSDTWSPTSRDLKWNMRARENQTMHDRITLFFKYT